MKVLFLTDGIHPFVIGGMQKHSLNLAGRLAEQGALVNLVHCGGKNYSPGIFRSGFSEMARQNITDTFIPFPELLRFPGHYIRENHKYSRRIYENVKSELGKYDLIYAQGFTGYYFIREKIKGSHNVPVLVNLHGFEMFQYTPNFKVALQYASLRREAKYHLRNADWVYSFGGKLDSVLLKLGVSQKKILLQSNGIQDDWVLDKPGVSQIPTFIFIGRNERRKGILELTAVLHEMCKRSKEDGSFRFHFVGPIPAEFQIEDNRVTYHGEIRNPDELVHIIDQCDCLVCPSYAEGMPTVLLEAMARGLAVIGTNVGAVSRMIDGNGILLNEMSEEKLHSALIEVQKMSSAELLQMKMRSIQLVKDNFTWSKVVQQKLADFEKIPSNRSAQHSA